MIRNGINDLLIAYHIRNHFNRSLHGGIEKKKKEKILISRISCILKRKRYARKGMTKEIRAPFIESFESYAIIFIF